MSKSTTSRNLIPDNTSLAGRDIKKNKSVILTNEKENNKGYKLTETEVIKKTANVNFADTVSNYFGSDTPKLWLTLTFRDKRIVNGTNVDSRIDLENEYSGYIPEHQITYLEKDHQANVGVGRTTRAIKDFFYRGQYMFKTYNNTDKYGVKHYKIHRTPSLYDISKKFFYVVELGTNGKRRHIHALIALRSGKQINNLIQMNIQKILQVWQKNEGFYKASLLKRKELDQKFAYMSKQQYLLKDFTKNQFDNYNELFGYQDDKQNIIDFHYQSRILGDDGLITKITKD